jgi:hypothetical protein
LLISGSKHRARAPDAREFIERLDLTVAVVALLVRRAGRDPLMGLLDRALNDFVAAVKTNELAALERAAEIGDEHARGAALAACASADRIVERFGMAITHVYRESLVGDRAC